jgi:hypothetical protein
MRINATLDILSHVLVLDKEQPTNVQSIHEIHDQEENIIGPRNAKRRIWSIAGTYNLIGQ